MYGIGRMHTEMKKKKQQERHNRNQTVAIATARHGNAGYQI